MYSTYCLACEVSKHEIQLFKKSHRKTLPCFTENKRHVFKKSKKKPKIVVNQIEFIFT